MENRFYKYFIIPILLYLVIVSLVAGVFSFIGYFLGAQYHPFLYHLFSVLTGTGLIAFLLTGYIMFLKDKKKIEELFVKRSSEFERFLDIFYEYCIDKALGADILKRLQHEFRKISLYLSDKTIALFNHFFMQSEEYEKDTYLSKKEQKAKRVSYEECILALREELGITKKNKKSLRMIHQTKAIFNQMDINWFEWSKNRIWHFETCLDYGISSLELMKKHNLVFTGGGPKSVNAAIVKNIKKGDIILAHKYAEGYMAIGLVTVDTKTIVWPKDNPLMYTDGEIRIPVRWLMTLNVGVDPGYLPSGNICRISHPEKSLIILDAMVKRAAEAGNEYSKNEIAGLIKNMRTIFKLEKPRWSLE